MIRGEPRAEKNHGSCGLVRRLFGLRPSAHQAYGLVRAHGDRGAATIMVVAVVAVAIILALALAMIGRAQGNRAAAQAGADLGALAAVDVFLAGGSADPCATAREVMRRLSVEMVECEVADDGVVSVRTRRPDPKLMGLSAASARARAGPDYLADLYRNR